MTPNLFESCINLGEVCKQEVVGTRRVDGRVFFCLFGGGMITFLELANMVDATQDVGWGGGGMITFLELANMVDATQDVGWGRGGDDNVP